MVQGCLFYFDHELNRVCFPWNFHQMKKVARAVFAHKVSSLCSILSTTLASGIGHQAMESTHPAAGSSNDQHVVKSMGVD
jgi:hypothetical protein